MPRETFNPAQAQEVAAAFADHDVDYLFIGKSGAILLGYPGTAQDVDVFPRKSEENGLRIVNALRQIGFEIDETLKREIMSGKAFVQIKSGPFDIDLVFAPDGIENYDEAKQRADTSSGFPVASIDDIIASKRAANRARDAVELPLLEEFRRVYQRKQP
jgi:hypothetical protein